MSHLLKRCGTLYGIGAGPGDPELITVKGLCCLERVAVVAYPQGRGDRPGVAQQIIDRWLKASVVQLPLFFPYVQEAGTLERAWQQNAENVWHYLQQGLDVAFVSEGDVSLYSTFSYLALTLKQLQPAVSIVTIPGVCSPLAAAARSGLPLTLQNQKLAVLPALYEPEALDKALSWADVVVLMKVASVYPQVWQKLQHHQLLDHSYVIERCTWPDERIYCNLGKQPDLQLTYFSILVIQQWQGSSPEVQQLIESLS